MKYIIINCMLNLNKIYRIYTQMNEMCSHLQIDNVTGLGDISTNFVRL